MCAIPPQRPLDHSIRVRPFYKVIVFQRLKLTVSNCLVSVFFFFMLYAHMFVLNTNAYILIFFLFFSQFGIMWLRANLIGCIMTSQRKDFFNCKKKTNKNKQTYSNKQTHEKQSFFVFLLVHIVLVIILLLFFFVLVIVFLLYFFCFPQKNTRSSADRYIWLFRFHICHFLTSIMSFFLFLRFEALTKEMAYMPPLMGQNTDNLHPDGMRNHLFSSSSSSQTQSNTHKHTHAFICLLFTFSILRFTYCVILFYHTFILKRDAARCICVFFFFFM